MSKTRRSEFPVDSHGTSLDTLLGAAALRMDVSGADNAFE